MGREVEWSLVKEDIEESGNIIMNHVQIEKCPFCGSEAKLIAHPAKPWTGPSIVYSVVCTGCLIEAWYYGLEDNEIATCEKWGKRYVKK